MTEDERNQRDQDAHWPAPKEKVQKKEMHSLISGNPWALGTAKLSKKDVVQTRLELDSTRPIRSKLCRAIMNSIVRAEKKHSSNSTTGFDQDVRAGAWQWQTKRIKNILG